MTCSCSNIPAAVLTIDLSALCENWRQLRALASPAQCAAVVKGDAYGLGAPVVCRALYDAGCREFFVAVTDEALALRSSLSADAQIYILHGVFAGEEAECLAHGVTPILNSLDQIERWQTLARRHGRALAAGVQVDTGMARLGLSPSELRRIHDKPSRLEGITPVLVMSHLASAEIHNDPLNEVQRKRFAELCVPWRTRACLANSSGVFLGQPFHFDLVRPGAAIYGVAPTVGRPNPMRPVVKVQGRMIQWRDVAAEDAVGYNHAWRAQRPSRIATVSVGYADGYFRSLSGRAFIRYNGTAFPLVGRVSMDTVTVDVTDAPVGSLVPGAMFDLIDEVQDINLLAEQAGTSAYEVLTSLGARYRRVYRCDPNRSVNTGSAHA